MLLIFLAIIRVSKYYPNAYEELIEAERTGKIVIVRYKDFISGESKKEWLRKTIVEEYNSSEDHPEYRFYLYFIYNLVDYTH